MKIVGIITEYNPFHNGHLYHINKIKEFEKDSIIICVCSSCFTQRGDVSLLNKWSKTKISIENGIDIVIELPYVFSSQSADIFAKGALEILNRIKVDTLIFGSELNDVEKLKKIAKITINNNKYDELIKKYMNLGLNYPSASNKATKEIVGDEIITPNDILGLCYIKEILKNNYPITPVSIKRTNDFSSVKTTGQISSATSIREKLKQELDISEFIPNYSQKLIYNKNLIDKNYFKLLKYKIISEKDLSIYNTVDEGIENKILKNIESSNNLDELIEKVKSKRYTISKLKRMFNHILVGFTKEDAKKFKNIQYIRILGFSNKGKSYLNTIKKDVNLITNFKRNDMLLLEKKVSDIYSIITNDNMNSILEYKNKPITRKTDY